MSFDWDTWRTSWDRPEQDPRKPTLGKRMKNAIQRFLVEVLPDPPPDISEGELSEVFRISTIGDNVVFGPKLVRVEVQELYVSPDGGANNIQIRRSSEVLYPTQLFPNQAFFSLPPFVLLPTQTIVLNLSAATSVVGRVRYKITEPFKHSR